MSAPSTVIRPAVGCSNPAIIRSVVVLPQPDGPRKDTNSPRSAARLKSSTAVTPPANRFWIPVSSRNAMGRSALLAGAGDGHARARSPPDDRDDAHRDPREREADQWHRGRL